MSDLAECFAIGNIADVMVCMCQTNKEKKKGDIRLFLAKIRDNADGLILVGKILYAIKKLEFSAFASEEEQGEDEDEEDESNNWEE